MYKYSTASIYVACYAVIMVLHHPAQHREPMAQKPTGSVVQESGEPNCVPLKYLLIVQSHLWLWEHMYKHNPQHQGSICCRPAEWSKKRYRVYIHNYN